MTWRGSRSFRRLARANSRPICVQINPGHAYRSAGYPNKLLNVVPMPAVEARVKVGEGARDALKGVKGRGSRTEGFILAAARALSILQTRDNLHLYSGSRPDGF